MIHFSENVKGLYLSKTTCRELGLISSCFPHHSFFFSKQIDLHLLETKMDHVKVTVQVMMISNAHSKQPHQLVKVLFLLNLFQRKGKNLKSDC